MAKPAFKPQRKMWSKKFTYDYWMESTGVPIHTGFFIDDLRTVELGWWEERQCQTAFIQLLGQEGVSSTRITEIPAGESTQARSSLPSMKSSTWFREEGSPPSGTIAAAPKKASSGSSTACF